MSRWRTQAHSLEEENRRLRQQVADLKSEIWRLKNIPSDRTITKWQEWDEIDEDDYFDISCHVMLHRPGKHGEGSLEAGDVVFNYEICWGGDEVDYFETFNKEELVKDEILIRLYENNCGTNIPFSYEEFSNYVRECIRREIFES